MTDKTPTPSREDLTRPIIGIENRTALETFDIMCDRITRALTKSPTTRSGNNWEDAYQQGFEAGREFLAATDDDGPDPVERERDREAEQLYNESTANDPLIHSNRFPVWEELTEKTRDYWRARTTLQGTNHATD